MKILGKNVDPAKGVKTFEGYYVTVPWRLGFMGKDGMGVETDPPSGKNILMPAFNPDCGKTGFDPDHGSKLPVLEMDHDRPFWMLEGDAWRLLKKRVVKFSEKNKRAGDLPDIAEEDLDDLKRRLTGDWEG